MQITEQPSFYDHLEKKSVREILEDINQEDQKVALAVQKAIPQIEELVNQIVPRMKQGGRIFYMGAGTSGRLVVETVDAILAGTVKSIPQEEMAVVGELRPAPKIFKDTCRIDWNRPVKRIYDFVRGLSPYPAAWTELVQPGGESVVVKIFETEKIGESHQLVPGTLQTDGKTYIRVAAEDGFVGICSLQLPGKKKLKTDELLRGFRLTEGYVMK